MSMDPTLEYRVGDVFDRLAEIPDNSIDLIVSSPPFLALRSYLPDDHPDKHREIGSEPTPAAFIDTHLALAAEYGRVLADHGSLCYEIGDTYSGSGGAGGDYNAEGLRDGQQPFTGSASRGNGWPLAKSMCIIPHMFTGSLAYGRNLLDPAAGPSPAGEWRIRNVICWARPNPPVGALGDKFRPATSYITVACKGKSRYFDLDAVRTEHQDFGPRYSEVRRSNIGGRSDQVTNVLNDDGTRKAGNPAGAPPLDWHADDHPEDGDWLWKLTTQPYKGAHFATYPMTLPKRLIEAMCPLKVCLTCGVPSERITERTPEYAAARAANGDFKGGDRATGLNATNQYHDGKHMKSAENVTIGWTDCGCNAEARLAAFAASGSTHFGEFCASYTSTTWRTGNVLDPFGGSGTTAEAAQTLGRSAICIDIDERNADLARERVGMFLTITQDAA